VNARSIALALGMAVTCASLRVDAEADRPVFVTVAGHGSIRFRLAMGATAPCDSLENRMLFDGWLTPGRYAWGTGSDVICYQHTWGALREANWSYSRVVGTVMGSKRHLRPTEIMVSTD
jgi:hypothetical protein